MDIFSVSRASARPDDGERPTTGSPGTVLEQDRGSTAVNLNRQSSIPIVSRQLTRQSSIRSSIVNSIVNRQFDRQSPIQSSIANPIVNRQSSIQSSIVNSIDDRQFQNQQSSIRLLQSLGFTLPPQKGWHVKRRHRLELGSGRVRHRRF
jgi:ABC-type molybdenum transport system ATPase subunit/photorepair protein PhrA